LTILKNLPWTGVEVVPLGHGNQKLDIFIVAEEMPGNKIKPNLDNC